MAHCVVGNVVSHSQVEHVMDSYSPVIGPVYRVSVDIGVEDCADHVEVNRISAKLEGLPYISQLNVLYSSNQGLVSH